MDFQELATQVILSQFQTAHQFNFPIFDDLGRPMNRLGKSILFNSAKAYNLVDLNSISNRCLTPSSKNDKMLSRFCKKKYINRSKIYQ